MPRPVTRCRCEWPDGCGGLGMLVCTGCGGDNCVCKCGGEKPCPGCEDCDPLDDEDDDPCDGEGLDDYDSDYEDRP